MTDSLKVTAEAAASAPASRTRVVVVPKNLRPIYKIVTKHDFLDIGGQNDFLALLSFDGAASLTYKYKKPSGEEAEASLILSYLSSGKIVFIDLERKFVEDLKAFLTKIKPENFIDKDPPFIEKYFEGVVFPGLRHRDPGSIIRNKLLDLYAHPESNVDVHKAFDAIRKIVKSFVKESRERRKEFDEIERLIKSEANALYCYTIANFASSKRLYRAYRDYFQKKYIEDGEVAIKDYSGSLEMSKKPEGHSSSIIAPPEYNIFKRKEGDRPQDENIRKIIAKIYLFLENQDRCMELFGEINNSIKAKQGGNRYDLVPLQGAMAMKGRFSLPLLPKEDYSEAVPDKKNGLLQKICEEILSGHGLKVGNLFVGAVPSEIADEYVKKGEIFRDSPLNGIGLIHGKDSHLLQMTLLCLAVDRGDIELENECALKEVLASMIEMKDKDGISLWQETFDTGNIPFHSPSMLNSQLMLAKRELPELSGYLRLVHFRSIERILQLNSGLTDQEIVLSQFLQRHFFYDLLAIDSEDYYKIKGRREGDLEDDEWGYYIRERRGAHKDPNPSVQKSESEVAMPTEGSVAESTLAVNDQQSPESSIAAMGSEVKATDTSALAIKRILQHDQ